MADRWTLVTGASGFIGARLVRTLVDRGERVKAFVRLDSDLSLLSGLPSDHLSIAVGDVRVEHTLYRALAGCDRVYHLAAEHALYTRTPELVRATAVDGTHNLIEAARKRSIDKVVVTSSALTLGASSSQTELDEASGTQLEHALPYVQAKREAEEAALELADAGRPVVVVLPTAAVGPGDAKPSPTGRLVVSYLQSSPLLHVPVVNGGCNLVDVDDVVNGHLLAMDKGKVGQRYVLGGENLSFEQCIELLSELTALAPPGRQSSKGWQEWTAWTRQLAANWRGTLPAVSEAMVSNYVGRYAWVSSKKAETELGYQPSPVRPALARAVRWFLAHGHVSDQAARRIHLQPTAA